MNRIPNYRKDPVQVIRDTDSDHDVERRELQRGLVLDGTDADARIPTAHPRAYFRRSMVSAPEARETHGAFNSVFPVMVMGPVDNKSLIVLADGGVPDDTIAPIFEWTLPDGTRDVAPGSFGLLVPGSDPDNANNILFVESSRSLVAHNRPLNDPDLSTPVSDMDGNSPGLEAGLGTGFYVVPTPERVNKEETPILALNATETRDLEDDTLGRGAIVLSRISGTRVPNSKDLISILLTAYQRGGDLWDGSGPNDPHLHGLDRENNPHLPVMHHRDMWKIGPTPSSPTTAVPFHWDANIVTSGKGPLKSLSEINYDGNLTHPNPGGIAEIVNGRWRIEATTTIAPPEKPEDPEDPKKKPKLPDDPQPITPGGGVPGPGGPPGGGGKEPQPLSGEIISGAGGGSPTVAPSPQDLSGFPDTSDPNEEDLKVEDLDNNDGRDDDTGSREEVDDRTPEEKAIDAQVDIWRKQKELEKWEEIRARAINEGLGSDDEHPDGDEELADIAREEIAKIKDELRILKWVLRRMFPDMTDAEINKHLVKLRRAQREKQRAARDARREKRRRDAEERKRKLRESGAIYNGPPPEYGPNIGSYIDDSIPIIPTLFDDPPPEGVVPDQEAIRKKQRDIAPTCGADFVPALAVNDHVFPGLGSVVPDPEQEATREITRATELDQEDLDIIRTWPLATSILRSFGDVRPGAPDIGENSLRKTVAGGNVLTGSDVKQKDLYDAAVVSAFDPILGIRDGSISFGVPSTDGTIQADAFKLEKDGDDLQVYPYDEDGALDSDKTLSGPTLLPIQDSTFDVGADAIRYANGYFDAIDTTSIRVGAGSAASPSVAIGADDKGWFNAGSNQLASTTQGVERFYIDDTELGFNTINEILVGPVRDVGSSNALDFTFQEPAISGNAGNFLISGAQGGGTNDSGTAFRADLGQGGTAAGAGTGGNGGDFVANSGSGGGADSGQAGDSGDITLNIGAYGTASGGGDAGEYGCFYVDFDDVNAFKVCNDKSVATATITGNLVVTGTTTGAPALHAPTHESGGTDPIKLDDLATPDDNTDLDSTVTEHGLLPKLSGDTDEFLRGDGSWNIPSQIVPDYRQITATTTAVVGEALEITSGTFTVDLPSAATAGAGANIRIKNTGTGKVTIDPSGAETIDGQSTAIAKRWDAYYLISDGTNWGIW